MNRQQISNEFLEYLQEDCLCNRIDLMVGGGIDVKWDNIGTDDYVPEPAHKEKILNRINFRIQKLSSGMYYCDFFQYYNNTITDWYGFRFKVCVGHHIYYNQEDDQFYANFYFESPDKENIYIRSANMDMLFVIMNIMKGFIK